MTVAPQLPLNPHSHAVHVPLLSGDAAGAVAPPFLKGGLGGISETAAQANVAKSPSFPLWERGRPPRPAPHATGGNTQMTHA